MIQEYDIDKPIIKKRLRTIKLELKDALATIEEDENVGKIGQDAVERIDARLISKTDRRLSDLFA